MRSKIHRSSLAGLAIWAFSLPAHAQPHAQPRYRPVSVETRFKGVEQARVDRVESELRQRALETLENRGVADDDTSSTTVVIQVLDIAEDEQADKAVGDYGTSIEVRIDGEKVGEKITPCMQKGEAELIGCALSGLPDVMQLLPQEEVGEPSEVEPSSPIDASGDEKDKVALAPFGPLGIAGVVVAAAGVGLGVAGGIDLSRGEVDKAQGREGSKHTDYKPRGIGLLAAGGVAVAVGVVFIAVGVIRTKKKQRERAARVQIDASPNFAGLRFSGRF